MMASKTSASVTIAIAILVAATASAADGERRVTYENTIEELMEQRCLACHGKAAPTLEEFDKDKQGYKQKLKGPRMDSYDALVVLVNGKDAGALMRRLDDGANTKDKKPGNMYVNLGATDAERAANLKLFKAWVGSWNLKRSAELSDAERQAITAPRR